MWTMYIRLSGQTVAHICEGVSTRKLLDTLERWTMVDGVEIIEIAYGNEVYTLLMRGVDR